jgi:hypothetical protein
VKFRAARGSVVLLQSLQKGTPRNYEDTPEERQKARERAMRGRYGIEPEKFRVLLKRGGGRFDVCRERLAEDTKFILSEPLLNIRNYPDNLANFA